MTSVTYQVTGMTCEHCVNAITGELEKLDGVRQVIVDLNPGGESVVEVTSDTRLSSGAIATALDEAGGYQLAGQVEPPSVRAD